LKGEEEESEGGGTEELDGVMLTCDIDDRNLEFILLEFERVISDTLFILEDSDVMLLKEEEEEEEEAINDKTSLH